MRPKHTSQIHKQNKKREKERYSQAEAKLFLDLHAFDADKLTQKVNITFHVKGNSQVSRTRLNTRKILQWIRIGLMKFGLERQMQAMTPTLERSLLFHESSLF